MDGSVVMALPTDIPFVGGGLTVWEGPHNDEKKYVYDLAAGDICFLDNFIFHQGLAERWLQYNLQNNLLTHLSSLRLQETRLPVGRDGHW